MNDGDVIMVKQFIEIQTRFENMMIENAELKEENATLKKARDKAQETAAQRYKEQRGS